MVNRVGGLLSACAGALGLWCSVGCGAAAPGAAHPEQKPSQILGEASVEVEETRQNPLVVDWKNEQRADLEAVMNQRLAVVHFDGRALRLLDRCSLEGSYGFVSVTPKEQLVVLESTDEVRANLPLAAAGLGIQLGGAFSSGSSVELGMVIAGKRSSVRSSAAPSELQGDCAGATHFVRAATIGAFALRTGSSKRASTAAELFGSGAAYATSSSKEVRISDGSAAACSGAGDGSKPPAGCAALLRIELIPFKAAAKNEGTPACAGTLRWTGDKCTAAKGPYECKGTSPAECREQCEAGNAGSCRVLADLIDRGAGGQPRDAKLAVELFQRACELGNLSGCASAGARLFYGEGTARSPEKAFELFKKSCDGGDGRGCMDLGVAYRDGAPVKRDLQQAARLFQRACDGGFAGGCSQLGMFYAAGRGGLPLDPERARALFERACKGDYADGCTNLATRFTSATVKVKDYGRALALHTRACELGSAVGCSNVGSMHLDGRGVAKNPTEASRWFERACGMYAGALGCANLALLYERGEGVTKNEAKALELLQQGCGMANADFACRALAFRHASGQLGLRADPLKALEILEHSCSVGRGDSCADAGFRYFRGEGVAKNDARALELFEVGCEAGSVSACYNQAVSLVDQGRAERAAPIYARACELADGMSCTNLAVLHEKGSGVPRDQAKANQLLERGCELGNSIGCSNLGRNYIRGRGYPVDRERGMSLLSRACEGGFGKACEYLADEYGHTPGSKVQVVAAYRKGCDLKQANACALLGDIYRKGALGITRDLPRAAETLELGCKYGSHLACVGFAELLAAGEGTQKNSARAVELLNASCKDKRVGAACRVLSRHYAGGDGVKKSVKGSVELLEEGCQLGDGQACEEAAIAFDKGKGVPRDRPRAERLRREACRWGRSESCRNGMTE